MNLIVSPLHKKVTASRHGVRKQGWEGIPFPDLGLTLPSLSCRHTSIRTRYERFMRSVHIGCSRYSRRCLLKAPSRAIVDGAGARLRAQSPELDLSGGAFNLYYATSSLLLRVL